MNINSKDWIDQFEIVSAATHQELIDVLNRKAFEDPPKACTEWSVVGFAAECDGTYSALRRCQMDAGAARWQQDQAESPQR